MRKMRFLLSVMLAAVAVGLTGCEFYQSGESVWGNSTGDTLEFGKTNPDGNTPFEFSLKVTAADGTAYNFRFTGDYLGKPTALSLSGDSWNYQGFTSAGERIDFNLCQQATSDRKEVEKYIVTIYGVYDKDGKKILEGKNSFNRPNEFENFDETFYRID